MVSAEEATLVIIDVQERLSRVIFQRERLIDNLKRLIQGMQVLDVPILLTEQYPQGLGPTINEVSTLLSGLQPLPKLCFSCYGDENFVRELQKQHRKHVIISGIESHVCVYQTAADLIKSGYEVHVVTDCISSRTPENREIGFKKMSQIGATLTSTETILFELLRAAGGEKFKKISQIVR